MKTCEKKITHTKRSANEVLQTIAGVCALAKIDREARNNVLFDYGCRFVEHYIEDVELATDLLQDEDMGFWAWWMREFAEDDKMLLLLCQKAGLPPGYNYSDDKQYLLCKESLKQSFREFCFALIKRTEKQML